MSFCDQSEIPELLTYLMDESKLCFFENAPIDTIKHETVVYYKRRVSNDLFSITNKVLNLDIWKEVVDIVLKYHSITLFLILSQVCNLLKKPYNTNMLPILTAPPMTNKSIFCDLASIMDMNVILYHPVEDTLAGDYLEELLNDDDDIEKLGGDISINIVKKPSAAERECDKKEEFTLIVYTEPIDCWDMDDHLEKVHNLFLQDGDCAEMYLSPITITGEFLLTYGTCDFAKSELSDCMLLLHDEYHNAAENKFWNRAFLGNRFTGAIYTWSRRASNEVSLRSDASTMKEFVVQAVKTASCEDGAMIILYDKNMCCISRCPISGPWVVCQIDQKGDVSLVHLPSTDLYKRFKLQTVQYFVDTHGDVKLTTYSNEPQIAAPGVKFTTQMS